MTLVIKSIIILISSCFIFNLLSRFFCLPSFFTFICSGLLFNISGFSHVLPIEKIGHVGVLLLLFNLGVEISVKDLKSIKKNIVLIFMVVFSCIITCIIPLSYYFPVKNAIILGAVVSISSTATIISTLSYTKQLGTQIGKTALGIVILQDLISVILIAITGSNTSFFQPYTIIIFILFCILIAISYQFKKQIDCVLNNLLSLGKESFFFGIVLFLSICLFILQAFPLELGALMAGLILADTECFHDIKSATHDFERIFLNCFFIYIGTEIDIYILKKPIVWIAFCVIILFKFIGLFLGSIIMGRRKALFISIIFLNITELGFVIVNEMYLTHHIVLIERKILFAIFVLSLFLSPIISKFAEQFIHDEVDHRIKYDIFLLGINNYTYAIANFLKSVGISFIMLDNDYQKVTRAKKNGFYAKFSNNMNIRFFNRNKLNKAKIFISTFTDTSIDTTIQIKQEFKNLTLIALSNCEKESNILMNHHIKVIKFPEKLIVKALLLEVFEALNIDSDELIINYTKNNID